MSRVFSYQRFMRWWPKVCVSFHVCFSGLLSLHLQPFICLKLDVKGFKIHLNGALDSSNFEFCFSFLTHHNSSLIIFLLMLYVSSLFHFITTIKGLKVHHLLSLCSFEEFHLRLIVFIHFQRLTPFPNRSFSFFPAKLYKNILNHQNLAINLERKHIY